MYYKELLFCLCAALFTACSLPEKHKEDALEIPLFKRVPFSHSGVDFVNKVDEQYDRFEDFSYLYNGGGTAIGDINNDGLQDIFFTGNEVGNRLYLNKGNLQFDDITEKANLGEAKGWHNGVVMVDINNDGLLDMYVCRGGWKDQREDRKNLLYINQGNLTFKEEAEIYGLADFGYSNQASFFDFDNDGDLDVYIMNRPSEFMLPIAEVLRNKENPTDDHRDKLYRNDNGTFVEASNEMGITHNFGYGLGLVTADVDRDGYVDIYVSNDYDEHDYFYINQKGKGFKESIKNTMNHIALYGMGADIMDLNNDGMEDIFVTEMMPSDFKEAKISMPSMNVEGFNALVDMGFYYQYMQNTIQLNQGNRSFSEVAQLTKMDKTEWSWSVLVADLNNSGHKDVFITNGYKRNVFDNDVDLRLRDFFNKNTFQYQSATELISAKGDEIINLYNPIKERNYLFQNNGNLSFNNVSEQWGFTEESFSNGAAVGDLDNDGDLDLVINNLDDHAFIFENIANGTNNFLRINFKGPAKNTLGIGAKVEIWHDSQQQYQEFKMVRGYLSSQEPFLHFGVGQSKTIDSLAVTWPGGHTQWVKNVDVNKIVTIDYDASNAPKATAKKEASYLFSFVEDQLGIHFEHKETIFDDYAMEPLLPHKYSQLGPGIAVGDINGDGRDDVYICGAKDQSGALFVQGENGRFRAIHGPWQDNAGSEEVSALFFDVDGDGNQDLYIVNGGNEFPVGSPFYKDRLLLNKGNIQFEDASHRLPNKAFSGSKVSVCDFDKDGDLDIFIGERIVPQNYPIPGSGYLYENQNGSFIDITAAKAPGLSDLGLITDAVWIDYDEDGNSDLIVVGEWMPITVFRNTGNNFEKMEHSTLGLGKSEGWWYAIDAADFDGDGDIDLVVGNLGLNYKYTASEEAPFEVYSSDFDHNGRRDILLSVNVNGEHYPLRGKNCSAQQMPFINQKYGSYSDFSTATIAEIVGTEALSKAMNGKAYTFATTYFDNNGDGTFTPSQLPSVAQFSSVNSIQIDDFNLDGHLDILLAGNLYTSEIETPRNDASFGAFLAGDGKGNFKVNYPSQSGLYLGGDIKDVKRIEVGGQPFLLVSENNKATRLVKINQKKGDEKHEAEAHL
ncbi:VCBS repeat-containing protein [Arenibacter sp. GZD96]|uniref:VCBS repeat-containing protein n=1 Tax=Aurantibrevibacter litoralis TaxID=3106030 RepID=UPI002AFF28D3|nr:VCBS repeat-containing protein [Arenibacter sp. GZD-96]MEA1787095.1 VCBS repeat-containing protein [Arenibacter sp. GZD-96]